MVTRSSIRALSEASLRSAVIPTSGSSTLSASPVGISGNSAVLHLRTLLVQERIRQLSIQAQSRQYFSTTHTNDNTPRVTTSHLDVETIKREIRRGVEFDRKTKQPLWVVPDQLSETLRTAVTPAKPRVRGPQEMTAEQRKTWQTRISFYQDPFHFSKEIDRLIKKGDIEDALGMTRIASKSMDTVVAWGYLIAYYLEGNTIQQGIKLFNEMKKRKQIPSVKTYTVIFRSLAKTNHTSRAIREAVRIYISMLNDPLTPPNTIHLNAVLEVCARGYDLDSLYAVAATADNTARQPDESTFTIMFHAMRSYLEDSPELIEIAKEDDAEYLRGHVMPMIQKAKALWERVIEDWISGKIVMTESLVCSFGRILMLGPWGIQIQVLLLLNQTMGIPVMVKDIETVIASKTDENFLEMLSNKKVGRIPHLYGRSGAPPRVSEPAEDEFIQEEEQEDEEQDFEEGSAKIDMDEYHSQAKKLGITSTDGIRFSRSDVAIEPEVSVDELYELITRPNRAPLPTENAIAIAPAPPKPSTAPSIAVLLSNRAKKSLDKAKRKQERMDRRMLKAEMNTFGKAVSPEAIAAQKRLDDEEAAEKAGTTFENGKPSDDVNVVAVGEDQEAEPEGFKEHMRMPVVKIGGPKCHPGCNTLSMVLRVCAGQRRNTAGEQYWKLLTGATYGVKPDEDNWRSLLNLQHRAHNSNHIIITLGNIPVIRNNDVVIAMICCFEDKVNLSSLSNATRVLETIDRELPLPPPAAIGVFSELIDRYYRIHVLRARRPKIVYTLVSQLLLEALRSVMELFRKNQLDLIKRCALPKEPHGTAAGWRNGPSSLGEITVDDIVGGEARIASDTPLGLKRGIVSSVGLGKKLISIIDRIIADGILKDDVLMRLEDIKANVSRYLVDYDKVNLSTSNGWVEWEEYEKTIKGRSRRREERREAWLRYNMPKGEAIS